VGANSRDVKVTCRHCGSGSLRDLGRLPDGRSFAGRELAPPLPGGNLWRCNACEFVFRNPIVDDAKLRQLYSTGVSDLWGEFVARRDFRLLREKIGPLDLAVLDVGCNTGALLTSLPRSVAKFGVEPGEAAASVASSRAVTVLGADLADIADTEIRFDVIIICDVVEHVRDPARLIYQTSALLKPAGRLLITTGDPDAPLWKLLRSKFWYCFYPEHISFVGTEWLRRVASLNGLQLRETVRFNYRGARWWSVRRNAELFGALASAVAPGAVRHLRLLTGGKEGSGFAPPGCGATKDHVLYELQKAQSR
jgi:SAM-dependent methyltransferase